VKKSYKKFAFSALALLVGPQEGPAKTVWWGAGAGIVCLEQGADNSVI